MLLIRYLFGNIFKLNNFLPKIFNGSFLYLDNRTRKNLTIISNSLTSNCLRKIRKRCFMRFTVLFLNAVTSRLSVGVSFGCAGFSTGTIDAIFLLLLLYRSINTILLKNGASKCFYSFFLAFMNSFGFISSPSLSLLSYYYYCYYYT
jgi:hypothetical protein